MKYFDISPLLSPRSAVFPGDQPFSRNISLDFKQGHNLLLSSIHSTLHVGAHTDAPNHYHPTGRDMASTGLDPYLGLAQVIEVGKPRGARITWNDLEGHKIRAPRILLKTSSFPDPDLWNDDFNSLSAGLVHKLAEQGVKLIGIDTPSVDPADDKALESHNAIFEQGLAILEGIDLSRVKNGLYTLIALPLRIEGADASPVRAILLERGSAPELEAGLGEKS